MKPVASPDLLLLRGTSKSQPPGDGNPSPNAWQREMEKAQSAMWLGHQPVGTPARALSGHGHLAQDRRPVPSHAQPLVHPPAVASVTSSTDATASVQMSKVPLRGNPLSFRLVPGGVASQASTQAQRPVAVDAAVLRALLLAVNGAVGRVIVQPVEVAVSAEAPPRLAAPAMATPLASAPHEQAGAQAPAPATRPARRQAPDAEAVRVHCQLTSEGLMVWVGAAAGSGFNPQALATQLQLALARQSQRLVGLVCNGSLVTPEPEPDSVFLSPPKEPTWPLDQ